MKDWTCIYEIRADGDLEHVTMRDSRDEAEHFAAQRELRTGRPHKVLPITVTPNPRNEPHTFAEGTEAMLEREDEAAARRLHEHQTGGAW